MSARTPRFPAVLPSGMPQTGARAIKSGAAQAISIGLRSNSSLQKLPLASQTLGLDSAMVRMRMVDKLRAGGIADEAVLAAMNRIERHRFVDTALVGQAYEDTSLPIGLSQTISKPNVVARMISLLREGCALDAQGRMGRVLEIGGGCGYQAAVLSLLCSEVYSVERLRGLYDKAIVNVRYMNARNLHLLLGDGMLGYSGGAPYAGIIAAAGGEAVPQAWIDQLAVGGRIVAPMQHGSAQALVVLDKDARGITRRVLEGVLFVPLKSGVS